MRILLVLLSVVLISNSSVQAQRALNFDGVDDFIQTSYAGITDSNARTVEAWIRTTANCDPNNGGKQKVILDWGTFATGERFTFCILWADAIRLEISGTGLSGSIAVNDGVWHHVAGVYDPAAAKRYSLYVDGVLDTAANLSIPLQTKAGVDLRIGNRVDGVNLFDGDIDEVRIWDEARSKTQITNNMNKEYCSQPIRTTAYYLLNEGTQNANNANDTIAYDIVSRNDGVLKNFTLNGTTSNYVFGYTFLQGLTFESTEEEECDSFIMPSGKVVMQSGRYRDTLVNQNTCDSLIDIDLVISQSGQINISPVECDTYDSPSGNYTWSQSGTYYDTVQISGSCEQYYTIELTINTVDTTVSSTATTLTADMDTATYQWLDCWAGKNPIVGETNQTFTPTKTGSYAVKVEKNGCSQNSNCHDFTFVSGIESELKAKVSVSPNPSTGSIQVTGIKNASIEIYNMLGQRRAVYQSVNSNQVLSLQDLDAGLYLIKIVEEERTEFLRLVLNAN